MTARLGPDGRVKNWMMRMRPDLEKFLYERVPNCCSIWGMARREPSVGFPRNVGFAVTSCQCETRERDSGGETQVVSL